MKNNEFFKTISNSDTVTAGEHYALNAWEKGIEENQNFPILSHFGFEAKNVSEFLETIKKSGLKKFGYYGTSTDDLEKIVIFTEHGLKIAGTFEFNPTHFEKVKGLIFEFTD